MLNKLWPNIIIISIIYSFINGNINNLNSELFESIESSLTICIELLGTVCFWSGIRKIAVKTTLISKLQKILNPLIRLLFPKIKRNSEAYKNITLNIISNMLGLGNAATPLGIKAMNELNKKASKKGALSKEMKLFIVINTASIQIIPTTVIAIRNSLESQNPIIIILPIWIASICAFITVVFIMKFITKMED